MLLRIPRNTLTQHSHVHNTHTDTHSFTHSCGLKRTHRHMPTERHTQRHTYKEYTHSCTHPHTQAHNHTHTDHWLPSKDTIHLCHIRVPLRTLHLPLPWLGTLGFRLCSLPTRLPAPLGQELCPRSVLVLGPVPPC